MSISKYNKSGCLDLVAQKAITNATRAENQMKVSEAAEQTAVFQWAAWNEKKHPELQSLHVIPNGGSRNKAEAANLKRQGVKAGVSDIHLPAGRRGYYSLYIEMKSKTGRLSDAQAEWINRVREQNNAAFVCYSADEAIGKLVWYLEGERT